MSASVLVSVMARKYWGAENSFLENEKKKKVNKDDMVSTDSLSNQPWQRKYLDGLDRFLNGREARTPGHKLPKS